MAGRTPNPQLKTDLVFLVLQFLQEEGYHGALHVLEKESKLIFDWSFFSELIMEGKWDEANNYLEGFSKLEPNCDRNTIRIFFEIRKQKYLETLISIHNYAQAVAQLQTDLVPYKQFAPDVYTDLIALISFQDIKEHPRLKDHGPVESMRAALCVKLNQMISKDEKFEKIMNRPEIPTARLRTIVNQGLSWQHRDCKVGGMPVVNTLFVDHRCEPKENGTPKQSNTNTTNNTNNININNNNNNNNNKNDNNTSEPKKRPSSEMEDATTKRHKVAPSSTESEKSKTQTPTTSNNPAHTVPSQPTTRVASPVPSLSSLSSLSPQTPSKSQSTPNKNQPSSSPQDKFTLSKKTVTDLPVHKTQNFIFPVNSEPVSAAFHPQDPNLLLVGSSDGLISIITFSSNAAPAKKSDKPIHLPITKVTWSSVGNYFAVAYINATITIHHYNKEKEEITRSRSLTSAHSATINDLTFVNFDEHHYLISCSKDSSIKVHDVNTGTVAFNFVGHKDEVLSLTFTQMEVPILFSVSKDSTVKAWLFDNEGPQAEFSASEKWYTCFTTASSRLFACGAGPKSLVEINEGEGTVFKIYEQYSNSGDYLVRMCMSKKSWFVLPDGAYIKLWHVDDVLPIHVCSPQNKRVTEVCLNSSDDTLVAFFENSPVMEIYRPELYSKTSTPPNTALSTTITRVNPPSSSTSSPTSSSSDSAVTNHSQPASNKPSQSVQPPSPAQTIQSTPTPTPTSAQSPPVNPDQIPLPKQPFAPVQTTQPNPTAKQSPTVLPDDHILLPQQPSVPVQTTQPTPTAKQTPPAKPVDQIHLPQQPSVPVQTTQPTPTAEQTPPAKTVDQIHLPQQPSVPVQPTQPTPTAKQTPPAKTVDQIHLPQQPPASVTSMAQVAKPVASEVAFQPTQPSYPVAQTTKSSEPIPPSQPSQPSVMTPAQSTQSAQPTQTTQQSSQPSQPQPSQQPPQQPPQPSQQPSQQSSQQIPPVQKTSTPPPQPTRSSQKEQSPSPPILLPATSVPPPVSIPKSTNFRVSVSHLTNKHDCPVHSVQYFNLNPIVVSLGKTDAKCVISRNPAIVKTGMAFADPSQGSPFIAVSPKNDAYSVLCFGPKLTLSNAIKIGPDLRVLWEAQEQYNLCKQNNPSDKRELCDFIPSAIAYMPSDNNTVAVGFQTGMIQLLNVNNRAKPTSMQGHSGKVNCLEFTEKFLVSSANDGHVIFSPIPQFVDSCQVKDLSVSNTPAPTQFFFAPRSSASIMLAVQPNQIILYECNYAKPEPEISKRYEKKYTETLLSACFSHDGTYIICAFALGVDILRMEGLTSATQMSNTELCRIAKDKDKIVSDNVATFTSVAAAKTGTVKGKFEFALGTTSGNVLSVEMNEL